MSVPWDLVRVWSVESAGNFDRDMEVRLLQHVLLYYVPLLLQKLTFETTSK